MCKERIPKLKVSFRLGDLIPGSLGGGVMQPQLRNLNGSRFP